ncbi:hypothetical protein [Mycobacterium sp.]|uniref:hypothetical protein n=1 Tax=Mycobacterium sp. TaxID=1785 RepID=UPI003F95A87C
MPITWPWTRRTQPESRTMPWGGDAGPGWGAGGPSPWQSNDPEHAMRMVAVWGAVRFLADNISAMAPGLGLYKLDKGGEIAVR